LKNHPKTDLVAIPADIHSGSTVALCPPRHPLPDGGQVSLSKYQWWLDDCWNDAWDKVEAMKEEYQATLYTVFNGDAVEGDHDNSAQIHTKDIDYQISMAVESLTRPREMSDEFFMTSGTPRHVGTSEETVARELNANMCGDRHLFHMLRLLTETDVLFNIAHKGNMGRLPHTFPNALNTLVVKTLHQRAKRKKRPPDVIVRSHVHRYATSGDNYKTQAFTTPGWKLVDEYIHNLDPGSLPDIGLLVFICQEGKARHVWIGRDEYVPLEDEPWRRDAKRTGTPGSIPGSDGQEGVPGGGADYQADSFSRRAL